MNGVDFGYLWVVGLWVGILGSQFFYIFVFFFIVGNLGFVTSGKKGKE